MNTPPETQRRRDHPWIFPLALVITLAGLLGLGTTCAYAQLRADGAQFLLQSTFGILTESGDRFGAALAAGDFNRDGFDDLAIGIPFEDIGTTVDAGAVIVTYGSSLGLNQGLTPAILLHQDVPGTIDAAEYWDQFGGALATGDFNNSGYISLAVGVPGESFETSPGEWLYDAGAVQVFLGLPTGINPEIDQFIQGSSFPGWDDREGDRLGTSLATGDIDLDDFDDLLVGIPGSYFDLTFGGGAGHVPGSSSSLQPGLGQIFGVPGTDPEDGAGYSVAICNLNNSGPLEQVVAAPWGEWDVGPNGEGWTWIPSVPPIYFPGHQANTYLGYALGVGDFRGAGHDQLLIGAPGWNTDGQTASGEVRLYDDGFPGLGVLSQNSPGIGGVSNSGDWFGEVIGVGDFNADGFDDGVFGVPREDLYDGSPDEKLNAGAVNVVYGGPGGLTSIGNQLWTLDDAGLFGAWEGDEFGDAVAAGDFDGDGVQDLAIGASGASVDGQPGAGLVTILYGRHHALIFSSKFEDGTTSEWDVIQP